MVARFHSMKGVEVVTSYFGALLFCLLFISSLQGQDTGPGALSKGQFSGLLRAGGVTSQIHGDDYGGFNKFGFTGGVGVSTPLRENLNIQLEINYCNRGSRKAARPDKGDFYRRNLNANYIDIPILLTSYLRNFRFEYGLCSGILVSESDKQLPARLNAPMEFNPYELALNLGLYIPITPKWNLNIRGHQSLLPSAGRLGFVAGYNLYGGAYTTAIMFSFIRLFNPSLSKS